MMIIEQATENLCTGVKVRVRTMSNCTDGNCEAGEMQVQRC